MAMPVDLVLVRHGESEGNALKHRTRHGEKLVVPPEFFDRHSSQFRLTDRGREQACVAGKYVQANIGETFDRYYVSSYVRALETAALLGLPNAKWFLEPYLRERDWGDMDVVTEEERWAHFGEAMRTRGRDGIFWRPPNGESLAGACSRVNLVLNTIYRELDGKRVVVVLHGETAWCFRLRLERMSHARFLELDRSEDPKDRINNCQVLHYSRRNPETQVIEPYLNWMRSVCPSDLSRSRNVWERIVRPTYTNEELLVEVEQVPRILNDE